MGWLEFFIGGTRKFLRVAFCLCMTLPFIKSSYNSRIIKHKATDSGDRIKLHTGSRPLRILTIQGSVLLAITPRNFPIHSECAGQAGAVTRFPSIWASLEVSLFAGQVPPACSTSGPTAGQAELVFPSMTPAAARIWGPWQTAAAGFLQRKNSRVSSGEK